MKIVKTFNEEDLRLMVIEKYNLKPSQVKWGYESNPEEDPEKIRFFIQTTQICDIKGEEKE